jgi:hypothetical protein
LANQYSTFHENVRLYVLAWSVPSVGKYPSNDNGYFAFYVYVFFPLSLPRVLPELTVYISDMVGVLLEAGTAYPSRAPAVYCGVLLSALHSEL